MDDKTTLELLIDAHLGALKSEVTVIYYNNLAPLFDGMQNELTIDLGYLIIQEPYRASMDIDLNFFSGKIMAIDQETKEVLIHEDLKSEREDDLFRFVWEVADT